MALRCGMQHTVGRVIWGQTTRWAALEAATSVQQYLRRCESSAATRESLVGRLNHVAIAVPDVEAAAERYRQVLGAAVSPPQSLPEHGVRVAFVQLANTKLELLEPLGAGSPIANFLAKNPAGGMHHVCLEVPDIQAAVEHVAQSPARLLDAKPKIGAHGNPVVFLHPKDMAGVLTELEECGGNGEKTQNEKTTQP